MAIKYNSSADDLTVGKVTVSEGITDNNQLATKAYVDANAGGGGGAAGLDSDHLFRALNDGDSPNTVAIGTDAFVDGNNAIAIGHDAIAGSSSYSSTDGIAIGRGAITRLSGASYYSRTDGIAIGSQANAVSDNGNSIAIGRTAFATGYRSLAVGHSAGSLANYAVSIGPGSSARQSSTTSVGFGANSYLSQGTALGETTRAGFRSVTVGSSAWSNRDSVSVGFNANTFGSNSVAIGSLANADSDSIALGANSISRNQGSIAIGLNSLATDSDGSANSIAIGSNATAGGQYSGYNGGIAIGFNSNAGGYYGSSIAIGEGATAGGDGRGLAIGYNSVVAYSGVSIGRTSNASGSRSVAIGGQGANASGIRSTAIGANQTVASGDESLALGAYANASGNRSVALGFNAQATTANTIVLGTSTVDTNIAGALSKGSGTFKIDHPLASKKDTHFLVHSFIEGPSVDNLYRGTMTLSSGSGTTNLDSEAGMTEGTFVALNRDVQVFTTNQTGWSPVKGSVSGNILTISAKDSDTPTVSWMVIGQRKDNHIMRVSITDSDGYLIVEPPKDSDTFTDSDGNKMMYNSLGDSDLGM